MADETIALKFTEDYEVQNEHRGTDKATAYKKGQKVSFSPASAMHFLSRGVAEPASNAAEKKLSEL